MMMERLCFSFALKSGNICLTSIGTQEGILYKIPQKYKLISEHHRVLESTPQFDRVITTLQKRNEVKNIKINLTKELRNVYLDVGENLMFKGEYLSEIEEKSGKSDDTKKFVLKKSLKQERKNFGNISEVFPEEKRIIEDQSIVEEISEDRSVTVTETSDITISEDTVQETTAPILENKNLMFKDEYLREIEEKSGKSDDTKKFILKKFSKHENKNFGNISEVFSEEQNIIEESKSDEMMKVEYQENNSVIEIFNTLEQEIAMEWYDDNNTKSLKDSSIKLNESNNQNFINIGECDSEDKDNVKIKFLDSTSDARMDYESENFKGEDKFNKKQDKFRKKASAEIYQAHNKTDTILKKFMILAQMYP
jgi:hypothetical protein